MWLFTDKNKSPALSSRNHLEMREKSYGENSYVNEPFPGRTRFSVPFADIIVMGRVEMISLRGGFAYSPSALWSARAPAGGGSLHKRLGALASPLLHSLRLAAMERVDRGRCRSRAAGQVGG